MSTAGPNLCTTGQSSNLNVLHWTSPGNVTAEDGTLATLTGNGASSADTLDSYGYGFSIPSGSTIDGITVEAKLKSSDGTWKTFVNVFVDANTHTTAGTSKTNGATTTTLTWTTFGSASDTWGRTWTPSEVNGANFGPLIGFSATLGNTVVASIDAIRITVTYTVAATGYTNLPLMGVGLINTLVHGLTLGLCSWRWRPFTRTQTRTAGVMA